MNFMNRIFIVMSVKLLWLGLTFLTFSATLSASDSVYDKPLGAGVTVKPNTAFRNDTAVAPLDEASR